jgi:ribosomal protein S18 acetylase RimI-like enzyme
LEGWRADGWGRKLVEQFVAAVRAARGPEKGDTGGIWIGIAPDNDKVVKFYERVGFTLWPGHGLRMVMDL